MERSIRFVIFAAFSILSVVMQPVQVLAKANPFYQLNDIYLYNPNDTCGASDTTTAANLTGNSNLEKIYNYMIGKGLKDFQAAGVVGNISRESGGDPERIQGHAIGDGTKDPSNISSGWGLLQWTPGYKVVKPLGASKSLVDEAGITGPIYALENQVQLVWWHMNNTSPTGAQNMIEKLKQTTTVEDATETFERLMEGAGIPAMADRIARAKLALKYTQDSSEVNALTASTTGGCSCSVDTSTTDGTADVLLDPGHSGVNKQGQEIDPTTKLYIGDSNNTPEKDQVFDVATKVKALLEAKKYKVIMTKSSADDYVNLADRAKIANKAKVQIAVSIHNTPGKFGDASVGWVAPQKVGNYRENTDGKKITYDNAAIAAKSQQYADALVKARKDAEGSAEIHDLSFDGRAGLSPRNLPIVQLMSEVPWVYNEVGQTGFNADKYAAGIANGIMDAVKPISESQKKLDSTLDNSAVSADCGSAAAGSAVKTAINYAWPDYHAAPCTTLKGSGADDCLGKASADASKVTGYALAVQKAIAGADYVGGLPGYPGVDCGGFITRVMQDSGLDKKYGLASGVPANTIGQKAHMDQHPELYQKFTPSGTSNLRAGDIAINADHTYMYIGTNHPGFNSNIASSSISWNGGPGRAPMAGKEIPGDKDYTWYHFIGSGEE